MVVTYLFDGFKYWRGAGYFYLQYLSLFLWKTFFSWEGEMACLELTFFATCQEWGGGDREIVVVSCYPSSDYLCHVTSPVFIDSTPSILLIFVHFFHIHKFFDPHHSYNLLAPIKLLFILQIPRNLLFFIFYFVYILMNLYNT